MFTWDFNKNLGLEKAMGVKQKKTVGAAKYLFTNQIAQEYLSTKDRSYSSIAESFLQEAS